MPRAKRVEGAMDLDNAHGTVILDPSGAIRYCSTALCGLVGRRTEELVGMPVSALLTGYRLDKTVAAGTGAAHGCGEPADLRLSCADGPGIPVEVVASMLPSEPGALLVLEVGASGRRLDGQPELQKLAWSVEQSSDAVVIADADGVIQYVNPAFEAMSGFVRSEAIGRKPAIVQSGHHGPDFYRALWDTLSAGVEFRGVFINRKKSGELFHAEQVIRPFFGPDGRITHFVSIGRDVSERLREIETLTRAATHDSLTDLPNRRLFFDRLGQALRHALRRSSGLAVAVVDVDRFKTINDLYGHLGGDAVLQAVASRLQHCVRDEDTVARLGGDEFGLILLDTADPEVVPALLDKILRTFATPVAVDDRAISASVSIGACLYPSEAGDERELMQRADEAMYRAKREGGDCYRLSHARHVSNPPEAGPA
jgi:diguanylate cyclase (GGDEF)-like protein/PAS domain S-box-containing protein